MSFRPHSSAMWIHAFRVLPLENYRRAAVAATVTVSLIVICLAGARL